MDIKVVRDSRLSVPTLRNLGRRIQSAGISPWLAAKSPCLRATRVVTATTAKDATHNRMERGIGARPI